MGSLLGARTFRGRADALFRRCAGHAGSHAGGDSEAYETVLRGLDWGRGDQLLITGEEEPTHYLPSLHLRDRHGVELHYDSDNYALREGAKRFE